MGGGYFGCPPLRTPRVSSREPTLLVSTVIFAVRSDRAPSELISFMAAKSRHSRGDTHPLPASTVV